MVEFNSKSLKLYADNYLTTRNWSFLREIIYISSPSRAIFGIFYIDTPICRLRHVFIWLSTF